MNEYAIFAFVVTPAIVIVLGYLLYVLDERSFRKRQKQKPAE
jgi:hypothetical protein